MINHSKCNHENTKSARAACRRHRQENLADYVASKTVMWVVDARSEGYTNKLNSRTLDDIAKSLGVRDYDLTLAKDRAIAKARSLGRSDILSKSLIASRARGHHA